MSPFREPPVALDVTFALQFARFREIGDSEKTIDVRTSAVRTFCVVPITIS
jgi:hypothetical protein